MRVDPESTHWLGNAGLTAADPHGALAASTFFAFGMHELTTAPQQSTDPSIKMATTSYRDFFGKKHDVVARLKTGQGMDRLTHVFIRAEDNPVIMQFDEATFGVRGNPANGPQADHSAQPFPTDGAALRQPATASGRAAVDPAGRDAGGADSTGGAGVTRSAPRPRPARAEPYPAGSSASSSAQAAARSREQRARDVADWKASHAIPDDMVGDKTDDELLGGDVSIRKKAERRVTQRKSRAADPALASSSRTREQRAIDAAAWKAKRGIPDDMVGDTTDDELMDDEARVRNNAQTKLRKRMVWAENPDHMRQIIHRSREKRAKEIFGAGADGRQYGKLASEAGNQGLTLNDAVLSDNIRGRVLASTATEPTFRAMSVEKQQEMVARVTQNLRLPPELRSSDTDIARELGDIPYSYVFNERRKQEDGAADWGNPPPAAGGFGR